MKDRRLNVLRGLKVILPCHLFSFYDDLSGEKSGEWKASGENSAQKATLSSIIGKPPTNPRERSTTFHTNPGNTAAAPPPSCSNKSFLLRCAKTV